MKKQMQAFTKRILAWSMAVLMAVLAVGMAVPINAAAGGTLAPAKIANLALGKTAVFKSGDMQSELTMYNYNATPNELYPEFEEMTYNTITDNNLTWNWWIDETGAFSGRGVNATAKDTTGFVYLDLGKNEVINKICVAYLGGLWIFENVLIQVSTTPDFSSDVYTVFSTEDEITVGGVKVYDGGIVMNDIPEGDVWKSPWTGRWYVNSANEQVREYAFPDTVARYVRVTNTQKENTNNNHTLISELQVWGLESGAAAPSASVKAGAHTGYSTISLDTIYDNAKIYYTLDGSYPSTVSSLYTGPIDVSDKTANFSLRTFVQLEDGRMSAVADYDYSFTENVALNKPSGFQDGTMTDIATNTFDPNDTTNHGVLPLRLNTMTDGLTVWADGYANSSDPFVTGWAVVDLGQSIHIDRVSVAFLGGAWFFENVIIQVADQPDFSDAYTVLATEPSLSLNGVEVYNGGLVLNNGGVEASLWHSDFTGRWYVQSFDQAYNHYPFPARTARYIRVTNQLYADFGPSNTIISDIAVHYAGDTEIVKEIALTGIREQTVVLQENPTKEMVLAALPEETTITLSNGDTLAVDLTWASDDWNGKSGTFVASFALPANTVNAYGLTYTYVVEETPVQEPEDPAAGDVGEDPGQEPGGDTGEGPGQGSDNPQTGDTLEAAWLLAGSVAACALALMAVKRRRIAG